MAFFRKVVRVWLQELEDAIGGIVPLQPTAAQKDALDHAATTPSAANPYLTEADGGTITGVVAGTALTGGGGSGSVTLNVELGTSSSSACAGNDARLGDARTPTAHAASHQSGGTDEIATATAAANATPKAGAGAKLDIGWLPTGSTSATVAIGNDSRLSDSRAPTGAAGGDLGGTYPNPTVTALHTTTGPTQLVLGAWADATTGHTQCLKRSGSTAVGVDVLTLAGAGEFAAMTLKATPVAADLIPIEDSAAGNAKKYVTAGSVASLLNWQGGIGRTPLWVPPVLRGQSANANDKEFDVDADVTGAVEVWDATNNAARTPTYQAIDRSAANVGSTGVPRIQVPSSGRPSFMKTQVANGDITLVTWPVTVPTNCFIWCCLGAYVAGGSVADSVGFGFGGTTSSRADRAKSFFAERLSTGVFRTESNGVAGTGFERGRGRQQRPLENDRFHAHDHEPCRDHRWRLGWSTAALRS